MKTPLLILLATMGVSVVALARISHESPTPIGSATPVPTPIETPTPTPTPSPTFTPMGTATPEPN